MVSGAALDRNTQNLACRLVCLVLRLLDVLLDLAGLLMLQLLFGLCHENRARLLRRKPRHALEFLLLALVERGEIRLGLVDPRLLAREPLLLLLDRLELAVEILFLLDRAALETLNLTAALLRIAFKLLPLALNFFLCLEQCFLLLRLRLLAGLFDNTFRFVLGRSYLSLCRAPPSDITRSGTDGNSNNHR